MNEGYFKAGSARGNKEYKPYLCWVGAGAPPVCYPWRNRASGIPPVNQLCAMTRINIEESMGDNGCIMGTYGSVIPVRCYALIYNPNLGEDPTTYDEGG